MKSLIPILFAAPLCYGATWLPLEPTNSSIFFDADIIYENAVNPAASHQIGSRYLFEAGLNSEISGSENGLRADRTYIHSTTGANFVLQPYQQNNSSRTQAVGSTATATFAPANYQAIAIAAAVGNSAAGASLTWTVNYTTGAPTISTFDVEDWGSEQANELFNVARTDVIDSDNPLLRPEATHWSAFVYEIATDPTRQIDSISYVTAATGRVLPPTNLPSTGTGDVHILAFSSDIIPEPSSAALLAASLTFAACGRRRRSSLHS